MIFFIVIFLPPQDGLVMIDVNPFFPCGVSGVSRCAMPQPTVIMRVAPSFFAFSTAGGLKPVSVSNPAGDKIMVSYSGCPERMNHYRGCGLPVSIIIATNKDCFVSIGSVLYSLNLPLLRRQLQGV